MKSVSPAEDEAEKSNTMLPVTSVGGVMASVVQLTALVEYGVSSTFGQPSSAETQ